MIDAFAEGEIDVLVGTSLVTKGLDIPEVTLVGVVSADVALNLPDERAAERTYQLLAQAVGRAGRGEQQGRAIIQTYQPDHPAIRSVATGDADMFYEAELDLRRAFGAPPFGRAVKLTVGMTEREAAEKAAEQMAAELRRACCVARGRGHDRRSRAGLHRAALGPLEVRTSSSAAATRRRCSTAASMLPGRSTSTPNRSSDRGRTGQPRPAASASRRSVTSVRSYGWCLSRWMKFRSDSSGSWVPKYELRTTRNEFTEDIVG